MATVHKHTPRRQAFPDPIPDIITYGSLNLLAGASGVGKTCLMAWVLTQLRDGVPIFNRPVNTPVKLGYICADRGHLTAYHWLDKVGYSHIPFYSLADDEAFNTSRLRSKLSLIRILGECLDKLQLPPGSLVVVDPLAIFMGGNLNDYMNCAVACLEMRRECQRRQITLIGTAHASKQKADRKEQYKRLQDRILGSSALLGYGDTQLYLASPEETGAKFYTFLWQSHVAPAELIPLGRDAAGLFIPWGQSIQAEQEGAILAAIPEDGSCVSFEFILGLSGAKRTTCWRCLNDLIREGVIERPVEGQYRRKKPS